MSESSALASVIAALGLSLSTEYIESVQGHQLSRVQACVYQDDRRVPLMTYNPNVLCDDVQRGRAMRLEDEGKEIVLRKIATPYRLETDIFREGFLMFKQEGRTCSLASAAAILSDISLKNGGPAIDPFVLSDIVASKTLLSKGVSVKIDSVSDLNIQSSELHHLEGRVPFNSRVTFTHELIDNSELPENSGELHAYMTDLLSNPDLYIILTSRVTTQNVDVPNHDVVVVGTGRDQVTGVPYLLVAEPNGGLFKDSPNFNAVDQDWDPVIPGRFTTVVPLNSEMIGLIRRIVIITSQKAYPTHTENIPQSL